MEQNGVCVCACQRERVQSHRSPPIKQHTRTYWRSTLVSLTLGQSSDRRQNCSSMCKHFWLPTTTDGVDIATTGMEWRIKNYPNYCIYCRFSMLFARSSEIDCCVAMYVWVCVYYCPCWFLSSLAAFIRPQGNRRKIREINNWKKTIREIIARKSRCWCVIGSRYTRFFFYSFTRSFSCFVVPATATQNHFRLYFVMRAVCILSQLHHIMSRRSQLLGCSNGCYYQQQ